MIAMAKVHKYDMSRRLDNGKWEVVGKGYQDSQTGRITLWVEPEKMAKIARRQTESVPFILFDKSPEPATQPGQHPAPKLRVEPVAQRTAKFVPKPTMPPPIVARASDDWPPEFDDSIPF